MAARDDGRVEVRSYRTVFDLEGGCIASTASG
jgi:hypothetical protein